MNIKEDFLMQTILGSVAIAALLSFSTLVKAESDEYVPNGLAAVWSYSRGNHHLEMLRNEHALVMRSINSKKVMHDTPWSPTGLAAVWSYSRGEEHLNVLRAQNANVKTDKQHKVQTTPWQPKGLAAVWSYSRGDQHFQMLRKEYDGIQTTHAIVTTKTKSENGS